MEQKRADHEQERRRHSRLPIARLCKVRDVRELLYAPGETVDVSASGALLALRRLRPFTPGERIDVAVAWDRTALVTSENMVRGTVRRVSPAEGDVQRVAVEFAEPLSPAQSAPIRAAA